MELPKVYIGFAKGGAVLSKIISAFTNDGPSHSFLLYYDEEFGGWLNLGSEIGGWVHLPAEASGNVVALKELPGIELWSGLRKNRQWLGAKYDVGGLIGMSAVMVAWNWAKIQIRNPLASHSSWFCSEIIAQVCIDSGVKLELAPASTDPKRLLSELEKAGAVDVPWPDLSRPPSV